MLLTNYIRSAWRNILRHKLFSIINILGLAIGLAAVMLIALYVRYETSYDSFWKNADNIYRVHTSYQQPGIAPQNWASTSPLMKEVFEQDFPQIEYATRMVRQNPTISYGDKHFQDRVSLVDPDFSKIFDFNVISGELDGAMENMNDLIITQSMVDKIIEGTDPIGELITIKFLTYTLDYKVVAVIEDLPDNTMMDIGIIVPFNDNEWLETWVMQHKWLSFGGPTFFTTYSDANVQDIRDQLANFVDNHYIAFENIEGKKTSDILSLNIFNIRDVHLKAGAELERRPIGDQANVAIFIIVSISILLIASINFVNLSTARATTRAKEVSLRKTVGATRQNLIFQFLGESIVLSVVSLFLACCVVEATIPFYNNLLGLNLNFNFLSIESIWLLGSASIVGILGGLYPAFVLSSFQPVKVLKANKSSTSNVSAKTRGTLVILQFTISICLFVSTAVIYSQVTYIKTENLGFDQKNLLIINAFGRDSVSNKSDLLRSEIENLPNVANVTTSNFMPAPRSAEVRTLWREKSEDDPGIRINSSYVGYDYFKTYDIQMLTGREYERDRDFNMPTFEEIGQGKSNLVSVVINEAAARQFKLGTAEEALGETIIQRGGRINDVRMYREFRIIGIIPDLKLENMKKEVRGEVFFLDDQRTEVFSVRYMGDPSKVIEDIDEIWRREVPTVQLDFEFAEARMINEYIKEINELNMFAAFSGLAIFIACLGLFGLASFTAERRTKEIGIRKVFGAEVFQIVKLLVWQFSKPVLIANIIAWPIAYLAMSRWLESFVYRIDDMMIIALCLVAGLTALLIAWATVAGNSYAVARQNPIKALRYE